MEPRNCFVRVVFGFAALCTMVAAQPVRGQSILAEAHIPLTPSNLSSSQDVSDAAGPRNPHEDGAATIAVPGARSHSFVHSLGFSVHAGINGIGGDIALPVAPRFNVRVGGEYFGYSTHFTQDGADVDASLRLGNGKAALDWFPFGNRFRVSPQVMFAIQTSVDATVLVPSGRSISLDGSDYVSSNADPLRGSAKIRTRTAAPGLTVGWGNIAPRGEKHWSFPVELGFYYIGQPSLAVTFQGSACDPQYAQPLGCQDVTKDADFQKSLAAFIRRNQNNLSYASFFPVASFGTGYRF